MGWPKGRGKAASPSRGASRSPSRTVASSALAEAHAVGVREARADRLIVAALDALAETHEAQSSAGKAFIASANLLLMSLRVPDAGPAPDSPRLLCTACGAPYGQQPPPPPASSSPASSAPPDEAG